MNKKELYESIMRQVSYNVKKALNEGAGAGYTIKIEGMSIDNFDAIKIIKKGDKELLWQAPLKPGVVEKWSAIGYEDGVTSDGIEYNGDTVMEYCDDDKRVEGGYVIGTLSLDEVNEHQDFEFTDDEYETLNDVPFDVIKQVISDIYEYIDVNIEVLYGAGWSHCNLDNTFNLYYTTRYGLSADNFIANPDEFHYIDNNEGYYYNDNHIKFASINAPNIAQNINWFFQNCNDFDEIFGNKEDDED